MSSVSGAMDHGASNETLNHTSTGRSVEAPWFQILGAQVVLSWAMIGVGFAGIIGNILIVLVYTKLGFSETIHISYTALAVSDLLCVVFAVLNGVCQSNVLEPVFERYNLKVNMQDLAVFIGSRPHVVFSRITALLTAWISVERCLCVTFPTKIKSIITRNVTVGTIVSIFVLGLCPMVLLIYTRTRFEWQFDSHTNRSTLFITVGRDLINFRNMAGIVLYGFLYPICSWVIVIICTTFLSIRLKQSSKWRKLNASVTATDVAGTGTNQRQLSTKESRVIKTVVIVASVFLFCSVPVTGQILINLSLPGYGSWDSLWYVHRIYRLSCELLTEVNSSINVIVFSVSGLKFRSALYSMLFKTFSTSGSNN